MRLHHFIEQLESYKTVVNKSSRRETKGAQEIIEITNKTIDIIDDRFVQFDIGSLYNDLPLKQIIELQEYSIDMIKNGLNILPYENIALSFNYRYESILIISKQEDKIETLLTAKAPDNCVAQSFINAFSFQENEKEFKIESSFLFDTDDFEMDDASLKDIGNTCLQIILAFCAILNSRNTEIITTPAPKRLNEKRAKKGKPPIGEIKEIRINYGGKRYMIDGREEGGTHASPRLHWRRGHVRRLASGKITNVRPTLVGAIKGEEPKMPVYKITNTKEHRNDI